MIPTLSRRHFLAMLAASVAAGCSRPSALDPDGVGQPTGATSITGVTQERVLVVVELRGGNDGLSTLVPWSSARYHDLRPRLGLTDDQLIEIDADRAWNAQLGALASRGLHAVEGIGAPSSDLSHFNMTERWVRGAPSGLDGAPRTGFLGRLTDAVDDGSPLVGLSVAGPTPHLINQHAGAAAIEDVDASWFFTADYDGAEAFTEAYQLLSAYDGDAALADAYRSAFEVGHRLAVTADEEQSSGFAGAVTPEEWGDAGELGRQLRTASAVLRAGLGSRVVYAALDGFDTHDDHSGLHPQLLGEVNRAVDLFLRDIEAAGLADRVVVATTSEFGRRPAENDQGLDHGTASTMVVAGAVTPGFSGEPVDLSALDDDGNPASPISFDRYLASLTEEWLGVEAASVLPTEPEPLAIW